LYKVCILAAGKGTRNRHAKINKALIPLGTQTVLDYLIAKFPSHVEIVIAVGYNSDIVKWYSSKWGDRIEFIDVQYEGEGVGPGYSLLQCEPLLQCPFIYMACDTIVTDDIPEPLGNWIGFSEVTEKDPYLTMSISEGRVLEVYDKCDANATYDASIGLVGVKDYKDFFEGLSHPTIVHGEHQDTSGIASLIPNGLQAIRFNWLDTGSTEGYENARRCFNKIIS